MGKCWIFFLILISSLFHAQKIEWSAQKKLSWDNFKAAKNFRSGNDHSAAAYSYCGISYNVTKSSLPEGAATVTVKAIFLEDKSWKKSVNPGIYLLKHEQLHFDIAEVFARKIRKMVNEKIKTTSDFDRDFKREYNTIFKAYQIFQTAYDQDTKNSIIPEKQEAYNRMVAEMLHELSDYQ